MTPKALPKQVYSAMRYVGNGAFVAGVPARDLSAEEWAALTEDQREIAIKNQLYEAMPSESE